MQRAFGVLWQATVLELGRFLLALGRSWVALGRSEVVLGGRSFASTRIGGGVRGGGSGTPRERSWALWWHALKFIGRSRALLDASGHLWIGAGSPLQGLEGECEGVGQAPLRKRSCGF